MPGPMLAFGQRTPPLATPTVTDGTPRVGPTGDSGRGYRSRNQRYPQPVSSMPVSARVGRR